LSMGCNGSYVPGRCATATCALLIASCLFINSQIPHWRWCFFGYGNGGGSTSLLRLGDVGVWRRPLASTSVENPRSRSEFFYLLECYYLQSVENNCFFLVWFLVFMLVCSCNLIFN
jgi:hypothetical protein